MFRTEIEPLPSINKINIGASLISIGSCFADNIAQQLIDMKFDCLKNPFGTIYNPISIVNLLTQSLNNSTSTKDSYLVRADVHNHFDFHSDLSALSKNKLNQNIDSAISTVHGELKKCHWLIITMGTAFVYELKSSKRIVANCHKMPATEFNKRLLSMEEIVDSTSDFLNSLERINPHINVILTVSPVRHTKDSLEGNNISKSILRLACASIESKFSNVMYFPSYEIMMDDLRDYRFYTEDLIHPNNTAQEYIWSKFREVFFSKDTNDFVEKWSNLRSAIYHRPFHASSIAHQKFLKKTINKLEALDYPIDVSQEIKSLKNQIIPGFSG